MREQMEMIILETKREPVKEWKIENMESLKRHL